MHLYTFASLWIRKSVRPGWLTITILKSWESFFKHNPQQILVKCNNYYHINAVSIFPNLSFCVFLKKISAIALLFLGCTLIRVQEALEEKPFQYLRNIHLFFCSANIHWAPICAKQCSEAQCLGLHLGSFPCIILGLSLFSDFRQLLAFLSHLYAVVVVSSWGHEKEDSH